MSSSTTKSSTRKRSSAKTRPGGPAGPPTRKLSDHAKHVRAPKGIVSTGWPAVERKCLDMGLRFRWWQKPIGQLILSKRADGKYASTIGGTGLSIPRQVGKTFLVGAIVFALCLLRPKLTVVWTAHRVRTAEETFGKMQAFAKRKRIAPFIEKIVLGSGDEAIIFRNGSRILFGARATGFGRGFDEVDVLIFDEAQILTEASLDDMIPATNQSRQDCGALLLFMGTPPKPADPGEVFTRMRVEALSGEDDDTGWVEFGADDDYGVTPLPAPLTDADWKQVAKANPSFPQDTPREAILRMRKKLGQDSFDREGMGKWDRDQVVGTIDSDRWAKLKVTAKKPTRATVVVDVSPNLAWTSIGLASDYGGRVLLLVDRAAGTDDVIGRVQAVLENLDKAVEVALTPGAKVLVPDFTAAKIKHVVLTGVEANAGCSWLLAAVRSWTAVHVGQTVLTDATRTARTKLSGKTQVWNDKRDIDLDLTAINATSIAGQRWAMHASKPVTPPPPPRRLGPAGKPPKDDLATAGF